MARTKFTGNKNVSNVMSFANASSAARKHKLQGKTAAVGEPVESTKLIDRKKTTRTTDSAKLSEPIKPTEAIKGGRYKKPLRGDRISEDTRVLYWSILHGTTKIDHGAVAKALGITKPAARMRHVRLMKKIEALLAAESEATKETDETEETEDSLVQSEE